MGKGKFTGAPVLEDREIVDFLTEKLVTQMLSSGEVSKADSLFADLLEDTSGYLLTDLAAGRDPALYNTVLIKYLSDLYKEMTGGKLVVDDELEEKIKSIVDSAVALINAKLMKRLEKQGAAYKLFIDESDKVKSLLTKCDEIASGQFIEKFNNVKNNIEGIPGNDNLTVSQSFIKLLKSESEPESYKQALCTALVKWINAKEGLMNIKGSIEIEDLIEILERDPMIPMALEEGVQNGALLEDIDEQMKFEVALSSENDRELKDYKTILLDLIKNDSILLKMAQEVVDKAPERMILEDLYKILSHPGFDVIMLQAKYDEIEGIKADNGNLKTQKHLKNEIDGSLQDKSRAHFLRSELAKEIREGVEKLEKAAVVELPKAAAAAKPEISVREKISDFIMRDSISKVLSKKRATVHETEVPQVAKKGGGFSTGYVSVSKEGDRMFMVKQAPKSLAEKEHGIGMQSVEVASLVSEMIFGPFYYLSMGDRLAPKIGTVAVDEGKKYVSMTSEFLAEFETMEDCIKGLDDEAKKVKFERAINKEVFFSAVLAGAEADINLGNLGIVKIKRDGKEVDSFAKIDHGRSGVSFFADANAMFNSMAVNYNAISQKCGSFKLDLDKMIAATDKDIILMQREMEKFIDGGIALLKQGKMDIRNVLFVGLESSQEGIEDKAFGKYFGDPNKPANTAFDELGEAFKEKFKTHLEQLKQYSAILKAIKSISTEAEISGAWLTNIPRNKDIILYLHEKNAEIDGLPALEYAIKNNISIKRYPPLEYAVSNNLKIDNKDIILHLHEKNAEIYGLSALEYAIKHNIPIKDRPPLEYAASNNLKIDGVDSVLYAVRNNYPIGQCNVIQHVKDNSKDIAAGLKDKKEMETLVDAMKKQDKPGILRSSDFNKAKKALEQAYKEASVAVSKSVPRKEPSPPPSPRSASAPRSLGYAAQVKEEKAEKAPGSRTLS